LAATKGAGRKAGLTKAAQGAAWDLQQFLWRYDRNGYFDAFVNEGLITERDRRTLYRVMEKLEDRGVPLRHGQR
jgi:hypothetical protein